MMVRHHYKVAILYPQSYYQIVWQLCHTGNLPDFILLDSFPPSIPREFFQYVTWTLCLNVESSRSSEFQSIVVSLLSPHALTTQSRNSVYPLPLASFEIVHTHVGEISRDILQCVAR